MTSDITYRIATSDDYPSILILYNKMYKSNRSLRDFEWLVEKNPAGRAILFIALLENRVVGMQSLIPYVFMKDGKRVDTYKSEDTLVEKGLRGKGILSNLYKMVHKHAGGKLIWGLTDKKEILERVDMPSSERLTIAISVRKPGLIADNRGIHRFVAKTLFYSYLYFKSTFGMKNVKEVNSLQELSPTEFVSQPLNDFFRALSLQNPSIYFPNMDKAYLNWRLIQNPNLERQMIFVSKGENDILNMCSIIGIKEKSAYYQSFYALSDVSEEKQAGHVNALRKKLFSLGVNLIQTWLFECNPNVKRVKAIFYQAGFSKVRDGLWIVHKSTEKEFDVHDLYFSPQLGIR